MKDKRSPEQNPKHEILQTDQWFPVADGISFHCDCGRRHRMGFRIEFDPVRNEDRIEMKVVG